MSIVQFYWFSSVGKGRLSFLQKACPVLLAALFIFHPITKPLFVIHYALFDGFSAIVQSMFQNDGSQRIHGIPQCVSGRMNHTAGLSHCMASGDVGRIGQFLRHGMTVQDCLLGNGHFDLTGGPCSGCGDCFPETMIFRVFFRQLPGGFFRQFQRPEDQCPAVCLLITNPP